MTLRRVLAEVSPVDGSIALALTVSAQVEVWTSFSSANSAGSRPVWSVTALALTASLLFRRTAPLLTVAVASGASALEGLLTTPSQSLSNAIALVLAAYSVAAYSNARRAALGFACLLVAMAAQTPDLASWSFALFLLGGAWGVGFAMRRREIVVQALDKRAQTLEQERDRAAAIERTRIARELHDIVSHRVTTMVVQAQAAETFLEGDPGAARAALLSIDEGGRAALGELRSLLGLLRSDGADADRAPQPGLAQLDALVEEARTTGVPAEFRVEGEPRALAPGAQLTLYRIAQEALTNVAKHARQAPTEVVLRYGEREVELAVCDRGPGESGGNGRGHGLVGMRERVAVYGGSLEAGPRAGGGFAVVARLPLGSGA